MPTSKVKIQCRWCGKSTPIIKWFIIADDLEHPKPYHKKCLTEMMIKALSDKKLLVKKRKEV